MGRKSTESKKPGVMIYFEILPVLENLWWWQRFAVLEAMIYYARDKKLPKFRGTLKAVWSLIQPIVDRDDARYKSQIEARIKAGKARGEQMTREAREKRAQKECLPAQTADAEHVLSGPEDTQQQMLSKNSQSTISNPQSAISNPQSSDINDQTSSSNSHSPSPQSSDSNPQPTVPNPHDWPSEAAVRKFVEREGLWVNPHIFVLHYESRNWTVDGQPVRDWQALARTWDAREREKKKRK